VSVDTGGARLQVPVESSTALHFRDVVRQRYDFSCGSAALATLLAYHYEEIVTETAVFAAMYRRGDQAKIRREGFSLLDIKQELAARGYRADGYRISLVRWAQMRVPGIALINDRGYRHFVVVKGLRGGRVLLGDPARGNRTISSASFEKMWNGIAFLVASHATIARRHFDSDADWSHEPAAPMQAALSATDLATVSMQLMRTDQL
jgi:predicted double-glycine peptidase